MRILKLTLLFFALLPGLVTSAKDPRIGLVLGGGGAKGAATVGALRVIEDAGIRIDYITGTSIGAIIGGLYAAGYTAAELEDFLRSQEWEDILQGHRVELLLKRLFAARGVADFEDTRIPFRCVATERRSLDEKILGGGDIVKAIRASMSIPKLYEPVRIDGLELVDGGMVNNLPVDVALDMGAEYIIAVDLKQDEDESLGIEFGEGLLRYWLSRPDLKRYKKNIESIDIHIHPSLPGYHAMSFDRGDCERMMEIGEQAAREHWGRLLTVKERQNVLPNEIRGRNLREYNPAGRIIVGEKRINYFEVQ